MEAKDTVLPYLKVSNQIPMTLLDFIAKLEEQAEISFKAGALQAYEIAGVMGKDAMDRAYKAGIREVVEWVDKNWLDDSNLKHWQAKLKEWRIE